MHVIRDNSDAIYVCIAQKGGAAIQFYPKLL